MKTNLDELLLNNIRKWEILKKFINDKITVKHLSKIHVEPSLIENKELMDYDCDLRMAVLHTHFKDELFKSLETHGYRSLIKEILNPENKQFNYFLEHGEFDILYKIIKKYCSQEEKNNIIKHLVLQSIDHHFMLSEYTGNCNELFGNKPFYFQFYETQSVSIDRALADIKKNKPRLDLNLQVDETDFVSFLTYHYSFNSEKLLKLLRIFPSHPKMRHILALKRGLTPERFDAKAYVLKNWNKEKELIPAEEQLEILTVFFNLQNPKCPYLKIAEEVCAKNNLTILGYVYKKENLDFLKQHYNFSFIHKTSNPLSFFSREYGGDKRLKFDNRLIDVYNILKIEPRNCLFVEIQVQHLSLYNSILEKAKNGVNLLSKNEKTYIELFNYIKENKAKYCPKFIDTVSFSEKSHLIDFKYFNELLTAEDLETFCQKIGINQRLMKKIVYSNFVVKKTINFTFLNLLLALKQTDYNYDRIISFFQNSKIKYNDSYNSLEYLCSGLKRHFSEEKCFNILKMIKEAEVEFIDDIAYSLDSIGNSSNDIFKQMVKDMSFKTIKELHDEISQISELMSQASQIVKLRQEDISSLEGKQIGAYTVKLPETNFDLIKIGQALNICVGNGGYFEKVMNKDSFIITLTKQDKLYSCIEIDVSDLEIVQAKLFANKDLDKKTKGIIQQLLNQVRKHRDSDE